MQVRLRKKYSCWNCLCISAVDRDRSSFFWLLWNPSIYKLLSPPFEKLGSEAFLREGRARDSNELECSVKNRANCEKQSGVSLKN